MGEPDEQLAEVSFTSEELIKLFAVTFLPLCEMLEQQGVVTRETISRAMSFYVRSDEVSSSATMIAALQITLRRPLAEPEVDLAAPRTRSGMHVIDGGLSPRR